MLRSPNSSGRCTTVRIGSLAFYSASRVTCGRRMSASPHADEIMSAKTEHATAGALAAVIARLQAGLAVVP